MTGSGGRRHGLRTCTLWILFSCLVTPAAGQNHTELEWQTLTTDHFLVHFHQGAEQTARRAAAVAEEVYPAITRLYDYAPKGHTHLIIRDTDDFSNGAAYYYDDKFEIWASALDFELRGTHNWVRDVVTHEFTHMVSLQAAARLPHRVPAIYVQAFGYEQERREDVLIGYPNTIVSYPLSGTLASAWWAEGIAQYQTAKIYNDWWDSHRDMLLRAAVLDGTLLSYEEMGNLNKNGLEAEQVYNQGYSLARWIAAEYGETALAEISRGLTRLVAVSESGAFRQATGQSGAELYDAWRAELEEHYGRLAAEIGPTAVVGQPLSNGGYYNLHPAHRPLGGQLYWATNAGSDFGALRVVHADSAQVRETEERREDTRFATLTGGISSPLAFSPDGTQLYYAKRVEKTKHGSRVHDVYVYDLEADDEERLTRDARIKDPAPAPDGKTIVGVRNGDGTHELVLLDTAGNVIRELTQESPQGTQYFTPKFSADGTWLLIDTFNGVSRDIERLDLATGERQPLVASVADDRNPAWIPGDNAIVFASDRSGIFNIYRLDLNTGRVTQVTRVTGGAFFPAVSADGILAFSGYTGEGYEVRTLERAAWGTDAATQTPQARGDYRLATGGVEALSLTRGRFDQGEATPYEEAMTTTQIMPRLVFDDGRPRLGAYFASREVLERQSLFGGVQAGRRAGGFEFELFALYENRMLPLTIFGDAFRVRRRSTDRVRSKIVGGAAHVGESRPVKLELRYDVVEFDAGVRWERGPAFSFRSYDNLSAYYVHSDYNINLFATDDEDGAFYGKDGWSYYVGDAMHLRWDFRSVARAVDANINPRGGRQVMARAARHWARLNPQGERVIDTFDLLFEKNNFTEYELDWREFLALPGGRHTLELRGRGAFIDKVEVDDFFHFSLGSRPGLRGYTYYSRQARKLGLVAATYRFPIVPQWNQRLASLMLHRLYGGVFFEAGNAWSDAGTRGLSTDRLLTDAGFELRLETTSFYVFPADLHYEAAFGFDDVRDSEGELTGGREWRHYWGLLFNF